MCKMRSVSHDLTGVFSDPYGGLEPILLPCLAYAGFQQYHAHIQH